MKILRIKKTTWSLLIYSAGVLLGVILFGSSVWGSIEAFLFESALPADETIRSLKCPVMITSSQTGKVTATFRNPGNRSAMTTVRTYITDGLFSLVREVNTRIQLEPSETKELDWTIYPEDAAWERFILVRVYSLRSPPLPSRTGSCGILLVNIPFLTGNQVVALISVASISGMAVGLGTWVSSNRPLSRRNRYSTQTMGVLAALVLAGLIVGILRWWFIGLFLFTFIVLLIVVMITYFLISSENGGAG